MDHSAGRAVDRVFALSAYQRNDAKKKEEKHSARSGHNVTVGFNRERKSLCFAGVHDVLVHDAEKDFFLRLTLPCHTSVSFRVGNSRSLRRIIDAGTTSAR